MKKTKCSALRMFPGTASDDKEIKHVKNFLDSRKIEHSQMAAANFHSPSNTSSGKTKMRMNEIFSQLCKKGECWFHVFKPGLARMTSLCRAALASRSPSTSRLYSSRRRVRSFSFNLQQRNAMRRCGNTETPTHAPADVGAERVEVLLALVERSSRHRHAHRFNTYIV